MILHLRVVPGFWIAVEERDTPELRLQPLVIGGLPNGRGSVREANLAAQQCGVRPGMTIAQAHQYCPDGIVRLPDLPRYERVWEEVCAVLRAYTPRVEPLEMGQAVCDLTGCERLWGGSWKTAGAIARQLQEQTGIVPWLGLASNRIVAALASTVPGADGIALIEPGQERRFLADLPLSALPDVDARLALTFSVLGLRTVGQLAALPAGAVRQRFGAEGERLHEFARGIDPRPVVPPATTPAVQILRECEEGTLSEALDTLTLLADACAAELQERHAAGTLISLRLIWEVDTPPHTRCATLPVQPTPPRAQLPSPTPPERGAELPIPYRIHSRLPQPGNPKAPAPVPVPPAEVSAPRASLLPGSHRTTVVVRTPIDTAAPLLERARALLLEHWPRDRAGMPVARSLHALELEVSGFAQPVQLQFAELGRLDETGGLQGMSAGRVQALRHGERLLHARYGDSSFRHVAQVDPTGILAERRFRWKEGLPARKAPAPASTSRRKR